MNHAPAGRRRGTKRCVEFSLLRIVEFSLLRIVEFSLLRIVEFSPLRMMDYPGSAFSNNESEPRA